MSKGVPLSGLKRGKLYRVEECNESGAFILFSKPDLDSERMGFLDVKNEVFMFLECLGPVLWCNSVNFALKNTWIRIGVKDFFCYMGTRNHFTWVELEEE